MPFDPTIPAHNDEIESAELRAQFNALNMTVSDPPTQPEMQTLATRLDAMLTRQQAM